jgi:mannose-1-phosphate guanylyltransferase
MEPDVLAHIPAAVPFGFDDLMSCMLLRGSPVRIFPHHGFWLDIGRVEDFQKAQDLAAEDTPPAFEAVPFRGESPAAALEPAMVA